MSVNKISNRYEDLILNVLLTENVEQIESTESTNQYFDKVVVNDNDTLSVYKHGFKKPFTQFLFDFSVDYATLLYYFEKDIYEIQHGCEPVNGFVYKFKQEKVLGMTIEEIIEEAKKKEKWSYNKKYNYGPIDFLHDTLTNGCNNFSKMMEGLQVFREHVSKVTDAKTFFVWNFIKFDLLVYCNPLYFDVHSAFPEVTPQEFKELVNENLEDNQTAIW